MQSKNKNTNNPLAKLTRLGNSPYYLYPGSRTSRNSHNEDPQVILLCSWTDALPKHIMKYIDGHRTLFPSATILLARTATSDFFRIGKNTFDPAIHFLISHLEDKTLTNPRILVHTLSNGGTGHFSFLARQYYHSTNGRALPVAAIIFDSTPTRGDFNSLFAALSMTFPRQLLLRIPLNILLAILIGVVFMIPRWLGVKNTADKVCDDLLEGKYISRSAARTFVYSEGDMLTKREEIEREVGKAEGLGMRVRKEVWVGSGHVEHLRVAEERYWSVVMKTWLERVL